MLSCAVWFVFAVRPQRTGLVRSRSVERPRFRADSLPRGEDVKGGDARGGDVRELRRQQTATLIKNVFAQRYDRKQGSQFWQNTAAAHWVPQPEEMQRDLIQRLGGGQVPIIVISLHVTGSPVPTAARMHSTPQRPFPFSHPVS
eukprot:65022-Pyramimonas_sp.AAC.1